MFVLKLSMFSYTLIETYKYSTRYPNLRSVICEKIWSHNVKTSFLKVLISLNSHNNPHCVRSVQIRSFFWSVFFRIRTDYGDLLSKFPSSVRLRENTDQKKLRIWTLITQWTRKIINTHHRQKSWSLKSPSTQSEPHKAITLESTYEAENLNWNSASL